MKQALHIFKKDFRYLRLEICLVLTLAAVFAWMETHPRNPWWAEMLLIIGAGYLIARLIHAEAIPGDNQFWITRPYRWRSLLGAKLLFIFLFVNLPIFAARFVILSAYGFPVGSILPGLLWSQLLIGLGASLPIAALATVTSGIVPFIFSILVLLATGFGVQEMTVPPSLPSIRMLLGPVQWAWNSIVILTLVAIALPTLYIQYKNRRTHLSRIFGLSVAVLGAAAYLYMPWPLAMAVQTRVSKRPIDTASIKTALKPSSKTFFNVGRESGIQLDIPIAVSGVPDAVHVRADAFAVTFQGSDGRTWASGPYNIIALPSVGANIFNAIVLVDPAFLKDEREQTVTLRGSLYLTLFGNSRVKTFPLQTTGMIVMDGLQCGMSRIFSRFYCQAAFRWPTPLVYAKFGEDMEPFTHSISYSPFPADLSFDSVEGHDVSLPASASQVTMVVKERLESLRYDFEVANVRLLDFVAIAK